MSQIYSEPDLQIVTIIIPVEIDNMCTSTMSREDNSSCSDRILESKPLVCPEHIDTIPLDVPMNELKDLTYIASGGGSNVYAAKFDENPVVIKCIKPEFQNEEVFRNEMESEIRILSTLDHKHVVKIYGAGHDSKGNRFIILEKLSGGTMDKIFEGNSKTNGLRKVNKSLPLKDVITNAHAIASAMEYFHSARNGSTVLHRDLKPDNIGFTKDGVLKIMDFGLASMIDDSCPESDDVYEMTGGTGSLRYMAPEVADSQPYNHKADVYAFGILLWELLSCKKPYVGLGIDDFYDKVVYGGLRPTVDKKWPKPLIELMEQCWDADSNKRPNSQEIVSKLEECRTGPNMKEQPQKRRMPNFKRKSSNLSRLL